MAKHRNFTAEDKVNIIREHLINKIAVSDVCDKYRILPTQFYKWQKNFFENGTAAFNQPHKKDSEKRKITELEDKIRYKDGVIVELLQEHMTLKKILGKNKRSVG